MRLNESPQLLRGSGHEEQVGWRVNQTLRATQQIECFGVLPAIVCSYSSLGRSSRPCAVRVGLGVGKARHAKKQSSCNAGC